MVLKENAEGDMRELGLNRIRYCEAAPKTSNMVDKGDEEDDGGGGGEDKDAENPLDWCATTGADTLTGVLGVAVIAEVGKVCELAFIRRVDELACW